MEIGRNEIGQGRPAAPSPRPCAPALGGLRPGRRGVVTSDREWVVKEGKHAGVLLKAESLKRTLLVNKVWDNTIRVKGREFDCLVVEAELKLGNQTVAIKTWFCGGLPRPVRIESEEMSSVLVDFGTVWSKRPTIPGESVPEKK
jgi:hypothetical protein